MNNTRALDCTVNAEVQKSLSYLLLKPDVVLRGILGEVLHLLEEQGFDLVDFRVGGLSEAIFGEMYSSSFRWDFDYWAYNFQAFQFGPVIGMLLWRDARFNGGLTAQELLRDMKGAALPQSLTPGSLRSKLRATSRVFNVLHVPDNFASAVREAYLWFGKSYVEEVVFERAERASRNTSGAWGSAVYSEVSRQGYLYEYHLDGNMILLLIKVRLIHSLEKCIWTSSVVRDPLRGIADSCWLAANGLLEAAGDTEKKKSILREAFEREENFLNFLQKHLEEDTDCCAHYDMTRVTISLLLGLNRVAEGRGRLLEFFWHIVSKWQVFVSRLENYLVTGALIYPLESTLGGI